MDNSKKTSVEISTPKDWPVPGVTLLPSKNAYASSFPDPPGFKKATVEDRKYEGGASRDGATGKGAPQWMPTIALFLVSRIYEIGNVARDKISRGPNYNGPGNGDTRNWENGMPIADLIGSAIRHQERFLEGDRSEAHIPQAIWNLLNALMMSIWVHFGFRNKSFNNLVDHIHGWKPGDDAPCPLSPQEIEWLKMRGMGV